MSQISKQNNTGKMKSANDSEADAYNGLFSLSAVQSFNKAAGHIEGKLIPMIPHEVQSLLTRQTDRIHSAVNDALSETSTGSLKRKALYHYAAALTKARKKIKAMDIREKATLSTPKILLKSRALTRKLRAINKQTTLNLLDKTYVKSSIKKNRIGMLEKDPATAFFKHEKRSYFRLEDNSISSIEPFVAKFLNDHGYEITDYKGGYASNDGGKNTPKIGKLLRRLKAPEGLCEAFKSDPCRVGKNLFVILSRKPTDITRASYERGWQSCRANTHGAAERGTEEYYSGVIAAYLVTEDDPDIRNPLGRLFIKPYDSWLDDQEYPSNGPTVYMAFNPIGLHFPPFMDAVNKFIDKQFNGDNYGTFNLRTHCESYKEATKRMRLPQDAEQALEILNIDFTKNSKGSIIIDGDLNLRGRGLSCLPDFRNVIVKDRVLIAGNKLLTLDGVPQDENTALDAGNTLISSFKGAPLKIKGTFTYKSNPYLTSTCGAPKASRYYFGNHWFRKENRCISPMEQKESFPSFTKK